MINSDEIAKIIDTVHEGVKKSAIGKECVGKACTGLCAATYMSVLETMLHKEILQKEEWQR